MATIQQQQQKLTKKRINTWGNIRNYFREYSTKTSIHGFQYLGEKRPICEKIWWILIFIICFSVCILCIVTVYNKWEYSPVIVVFDTQPVKIHQIPFPAVTVCSESKVKIKVFNVSDALERKRRYGFLDNKEEKIFNYISAVCDYGDSFNYTDIESNEFFEVMEEVVPPLVPTNCIFRGEPIECDELFTPIITDEGICSTFNILDRSELFNDNVVHFKNYHKVNRNSSHWNYETGYVDNSSMGTVYPRRALIAGARYSFSFDLKIDADEIENTCRDSIEGFTVVLHSPIRVPVITQHFTRIPLDHVVVASITPSVISTSHDIRKFSPAKRDCYFQTEKHLKYFRYYSQMNCFMENLTNMTLFQCGCVDFYMPRENGTRICGGQDWPCLYGAEEHLNAIQLEYVIAKKNVTTGYHPMNCRPLCTDISYQITTSQTFWNWDKRKADEKKKFYISKFQAYFRTSDYIGSQRVELYGPTDFLANFGGLLGLFTGFSFLSLMEIIYFLTVRLFCNRKMYGQMTVPEV